MSSCSCGGGAGINVRGGNDKVKVDSSDTIADFLLAKLSAGAGVNLAVLNPGGNEQVQITATGAGSTPTEEDFFPADLQTIFNLAGIPAVPSATLVWVNGFKYEYTTDFTVVGNVLTWLDNPFTLAAGDTFSVYYTV